MKVYLGNNKEDISTIIRLVNIKASLGVCEWAGDFKDTDYDCTGMLDCVEDKLDSIKNSYKYITDMNDEDDQLFFDCVRSVDYMLGKKLACGLIDSEAKSVLLQRKTLLPSDLRKAIEIIDKDSYIWII